MISVAVTYMRSAQDGTTQHYIMDWEEIMMPGWQLMVAGNEEETFSLVV